VLAVDRRFRIRIPKYDMNTTIKMQIWIPEYNTDTKKMKALSHIVCSWKLQIGFRVELEFGWVG